MSLTVDFKTYLDGELTLGTFSIKLNRFGESGDDQIVLFNRVNGAPVMNLEHVAMDVRRLQIIVRVAKGGDATGEAMCDDIITAMKKVYAGYSTASTSYKQVTPLQSRFVIGGEDDNHRPMWSCNWEIIC